MDDAKALFLNTIHLSADSTAKSFLQIFPLHSMSQPHILANRFSAWFHLDDQLILWILDFLTNGSLFVNSIFVYSHPCFSSCTPSTVQTTF